jgi:hypothetical protein
MRVFTDGQTHLVLGPGGLAIHRPDTEPRLVALGPKPKRGAQFAPPRDVLAPLDESLSRVLVTLERDAWEVPLDGGAPRKLAARVLDAVRAHDGRLFAVVADTTGAEPEARFVLATLAPGEALAESATLTLPPATRIAWPKNTIWESGVDPWPEADEEFDPEEHRLDAVAVGYSSRDGTTFFDAVHLATSAHGTALASTYSGLVAVVRPDAENVAFCVRIPATRDAQEIFAVPTREGVLVVTTLHGKYSAALHVAPDGAVLSHLARVGEALAFGLGAPFLVTEDRAVVVQSLEASRVTSLTLPTLGADVLGDLDMKLVGESSAFTTRDGRAAVVGLGDMAYLFRVSDDAEVQIAPLLMPAAPSTATKRAAAPVVPAGPARMIGPPALALSRATAGAGEWHVGAGESTTIDVAFSSAGGKGRGLYVEVGGPAFASGLLTAVDVSFGRDAARVEANFTTRGAVARAELADVNLEPAFAIEEPRRRTTRPEPPPPMPVMFVRVTIRGAKAGANLLTIRVGPLGAEPGRGSALQGKRLVVR